MRILPKKGHLQCWKLEPKAFCFRSKWSEKTMSCISNPLQQDLEGDKEWHHYAMTKS